MEDKLSELIDILHRLLQAQRPMPNQIDCELHEAMERFERDLPLTTRHVARLLDISERTVKRTIPRVARSKPGGTVWYSRGEVEALWQVARRSRPSARGSICGAGSCTTPRPP